MMDAPNRLSEHRGDVKDLEFGAQSLMIFLRHGIGHDDLVNSGCIDTLESIAAEDPICNTMC